MPNHIRFALTSLQRRATRAALAAGEELIYDDDCADDTPMPLAPERVPIIYTTDGITCRVEFDTSDPTAPRVTITFVTANE